MYLLLFSAREGSGSPSAVEDKKRAAAGPSASDNLPEMSADSKWLLNILYYYQLHFVTPKRVQISRDICAPDDRLDRFDLFSCCLPIS